MDEAVQQLATDTTLSFSINIIIDKIKTRQKNIIIVIVIFINPLLLVLVVKLLRK